MIVAGAVALTLAGAGFALAQGGPMRDGSRWRPSAEDVSAFADARIAALKAGLKLTPEQEKNWPALETALREFAKQRAERMEEFRARRESRRGPGRDGDEARRGDGDGPRGDIVERLRRRADTLGTHAASLKRMVDAVEPLYQSLDEGQKRRFAVLFRMGRHGMGRGGHGRGGHGRGGHHGWQAMGGHHGWYGRGEGRGHRGWNRDGSDGSDGRDSRWERRRDRSWDDRDQSGDRPESGSETESR